MTDHASTNPISADSASFGRGVHAPASQRDRSAGLRRHLGRRFAARRAGLGRALLEAPPPAGGHRHRQHLDGRGRPVAESFHRIDKAYPGRFLLGIGVGHPEAVTEYRKPYDALTEYLDQLDEYGVPDDRRVVAALGPAGPAAVRASAAPARTRT